MWFVTGQLLSLCLNIRERLVHFLMESFPVVRVSSFSPCENPTFASNSTVELGCRLFSSRAGVLLEVTSKTLATCLSRFTEPVPFDFVVKQGQIRLYPSSNGVLPRICHRRVRFYFPNARENELVHFIGAYSKILLNPTDFGSTQSEFGVFRLKELYSEPSVWVDAFFHPSKRRSTIYYNLSFSAGGSMSNSHGVVVPINESTYLIRRVNSAVGLRVNKFGQCRRLSCARGQRCSISFTPSQAPPKVVRLGIVGDDWPGFEIADFFIYPEEKQLARAFFSRGFSLYSPHSRGIFDLEITAPNLARLAVIEVTTDHPHPFGRGMFSEVGSRITAKIQSLRLFSLKRGIPSFVIIKKEWKGLSWLVQMAKDASEDGCVVLFTDFEGDWHSPLANLILSRLEVPHRVCPR